nr:extracellular ligand-binding receptor [Tanacetum cinerariifolium]GEY50985.1 extracellular ligand-binding receptor [Tanacetum cinerariifolium]
MIWFTPSIIASESIVDAKFLVVLGDEAQVPILSLSPTPSSNKHPYFFQITEDEATQIKSILALAKSFGWKNIIVICEDTDNGQHMAKLISNSFRLRGILVTYTSLILTPSSSEVVYKELYKLKTIHSKLFVIHVSPSLASYLFLKAKHLEMMDVGYKWIITSKGERRVRFWRSKYAVAFTKKLVNSFSDDGMDAIVWPGAKTLKTFPGRVPSRSEFENRAEV